MDHLNKWTECHLLSLPKAIRLEIWKHVLTDVSMPELHVGIFREPSSPYLRHPRPPAPKINVSLRRNTPINVNLLQVNQFIYEEALPILYSNAKFAPWDLEGLLPQFLEMLSPSARLCVRHIKLYLPEPVTSPAARLDPSRPFFNWAITCAQVAKLNGTLHELEVEGDWSIFADKARRRSILGPLLKITAAKKFTPRAKESASISDYSLEFQNLLAEVEQHLKANAQVRKQRTEAEALERATRSERARRAREAAEEAAETQRREYEQSEKGREMAEWQRFAEAYIKQITESENASWEDGEAVKDDEFTAADWDLVSVRSGASTPKASSASGADTAASTLVGKEGSDREGASKNGDESDAESESWEKL